MLKARKTITIRLELPCPHRLTSVTIEDEEKLDRLADHVMDVISGAVSDGWPNLDVTISSRPAHEVANDD